MRWTVALCLLLCCAPLSASDHARWEVQGRVASITHIAFPGGATEDNAALFTYPPEVNPGSPSFLVVVTFNCQGISCWEPSIWPVAQSAASASYLLGSCSKHSSTSTSTSPLGTTTFTTWSCDNQHYADCWTMSGYLIGGLVADRQTAGGSCLY